MASHAYCSQEIMTVSSELDLVSFEQRLLRLKQALGVRTDQEVAEALGMTKAALSDRKRRKAFPEDRLFTLAARRPELGIDPHWVMHGKSAAQSVAGRLEAFPSRLAELRCEEPLPVFAAKVGIPTDSLELLERGLALPTLDQFRRLVDAFPDRSPSWIAGGPKLELDGDLNDLEIILIRNYRLCSEEVRDQLRRAAAAGAMEALR